MSSFTFLLTWIFCVDVEVTTNRSMIVFCLNVWESVFLSLKLGLVIIMLCYSVLLMLTLTLNSYIILQSMEQFTDTMVIRCGENI